MKIAIIGAGFCGLATAWNLASQGHHQTTLFDHTPIGKGTSGIATGLLHGYVGARSRRNLSATEGLEATHQLITVAEEALGDTIIVSKGILRLAITPQQHDDFTACAAAHPDVHWRSAEDCQKEIPELLPYPGIWISSGITIDCERYLQGLWLACQQKGVLLEQQSITSLQELDDFDHVIVTTGASTLLLPECSTLPITPIKGQILELEWPKELPPLPYCLNSQAYLTPSSKPGHYIAGATFERYFDTSAADIVATTSEILPKIEAFLPAIGTAKIVGCRAGVRASGPGHMPLMHQIAKNVWVLTGMGSKGLLYHALYAKELSVSLC